MLEKDQKLLTWRLLREPIDFASLPIPAERIGDHRMDYLDYEGPVSGDRGYVTRVDGGGLVLAETSDRQAQFSLQGERLRGNFCLLQEHDQWLFQACP